MLSEGEKNQKIIDPYICFSRVKGTSLLPDKKNGQLLYG